MQAAIEGRDTIVIMPTGSGKSVCFQLPALALVGTTVVVSPLIALMKDQADALRERGVAVTTLNSTLTPAEEEAELAAIRAGDREFVYVTPERLAQAEYREVLARDPGRPVRRRRGALREPVGPRLPPRLPRARRGDRGPRPPARCSP